MSNKTGGRAFPCDSIVERDEVGHLHGFEVSSGGMTLRDYFAAKAMQSIVSSPKEMESLIDTLGAKTAYAKVSETAYVIADEMLRAREAS
ncbi:hypothetical protein ACJ5XR_000941 [Enterobacter hormaechei]|uniref:hypothetical protein n=1 Tax=Enterobacter kobei TaxID=208224 RepID=UPI002DFA34A8|nr:hypothetical protein [Enterobacter hormaechei]HCM9116249.1 hypothetical protein [Enterobacter hormaechei subsp. steigerwaltii]